MDKTPTRRSKMIWRRTLHMRNSRQNIPREETKCNKINPCHVEEPQNLKDCTSSISPTISSHNSTTPERWKEPDDSTDSSGFDKSPGITGDFFNNVNSSPTVAWDFIRPDAPTSVKEAAKRLGKELHDHKMKRRKFKHKSDSKPRTPVKKIEKAEIPLDHYKKSLFLLKSRLEESPSISTLEKQHPARIMKKNSNISKTYEDEGTTITDGQNFIQQNAKMSTNFCQYLNDSYDDVFTCPTIDVIANNSSEGSVCSGKYAGNSELDDDNDIFFSTLDSAF